MTRFSDFVRAGNQGADPATYEIENAAMDPDGTLWAHLSSVAPWAGRRLLDLGCGSGFWLPRYAEAAEVIGVEPDPELLPLARARPGGARVLPGSAEHLPLPDGSVDVVHARFAYFFPDPDFDPTPGLVEVQRVLATDGALVVIDNDHDDGEFADLLAVSPWAAKQGTGPHIRRWWRERGATSEPVLSSWNFESRADLEAVLRLEFPAEVVDPWLTAHPHRLGLSYGYVVHTWRPRGPGRHLA
ncbi:class I SAM-dependent methyltransferase [Occultella glacieicola]|uniref:Class I SAM-dependent methyltransferase n=1 Tax=Occultella glacieicola TaxID=2518684 RepID=A0ABY2E8W5_9MICO|nr:class I SAM-dependent methyltransferase [Occultella glacieicola]TDE97215.1 class I SAM-dependent methyltransferase [Occultella glacieicola]